MMSSLTCHVIIFRAASSKASADSRRKSSGGPKGRLKTPETTPAAKRESAKGSKREPTPSPYSSSECTYYITVCTLVYVH